MKRKIVGIAIVASLFLIACQNTSKTDNVEKQKIASVETQDEMTDITFTVAKNYFVKNHVQKIDNPKIETAEDFSKIFGMATTMAENGKPTEIDFSKQYVIAVLLPETNLVTSIEPLSLQKDENGKIIFSYKAIMGQEQTFTIRPSIAIIVDKSESGNVIVKEVK